MARSKDYVVAYKLGLERIKQLNNQLKGLNIKELKTVTGAAVAGANVGAQQCDMHQIQTVTNAVDQKVIKAVKGSLNLLKKLHKTY